MMTRLALRSLANRRVTALLTLLSLTISILLLLGVDHLRQQARDNFAQAVSGTDLIVGARTGPVNLLLYSVFHIGNPNNNISWDSWQQLENSRDVAWAIPISLGDSHAGFRVIGTSTAMFEHFRYSRERALEFSQGEAFDDLYQVVLGARVAEALSYQPGDEIVISHGTGAVSFADHDDKPFTVTGILRPTGTPMDKSLLTSLESIEAIHIGWQQGSLVPGLGASAEATRQMDLQPQSITAGFIGLNSRMATFGVQRMINDYPGEALSAILPGVALSELWSTLGNFENLLRILSMLVLLAALMGMATMLLASLNERRRELAILRAVGARPWYLLLLIQLEALMISLAAFLLGWLLLNASIQILEPWLVNRWGVFIEPLGAQAGLLGKLGLFLGSALLAGLLPALAAYRKSLADGLVVKT